MADETERLLAQAMLSVTPGLQAMLKPKATDLPAWQAVLARVRKLTRFDADSLELVSHDQVPGSVTATRAIEVRLTTGKERVAGRLPSGVRDVGGAGALDRDLQDQCAACEAAVAERLESWRAANDNPSAAPDSSLFVRGSSAVGYSHGCSNCQGRGRNNCTACGTRGRVTCSGCNGRGQQTCFSCSGHGNVRCNTCGGSGVQTGGHHSCISCGGRGTNMCLSCAGQRWVNCNRCGGSREERCSPCSGNGTISCSPCGATGTISVVGRVSAAVSASDTVRYSADDQALLALLGRCSTVAAAGQHMRLAIDSSTVSGARLSNAITGRFLADRLQLRVGTETLVLHGMRDSGTILDYRNLIGRLLEADVDQLAAVAGKRLSPIPAPELVDALGAVLESEAVSLALRGKVLPASEGTLIGSDFADRVRGEVGKVLRWLHWQTAAPAVVAALLLPVVCYDLLWRVPGDKHLNKMGAISLFVPMAIGLALDWWLRRRLLGRLGPVARPALQRLLNGQGYIRQARIAIAVAALLGVIYAMRMWIF